MSEWEFQKPDFSKPMKVNCFDDGLQNMENLVNIWYIIGNWREKVRLVNVNNLTQISSISSWKVEAFISHED
tara:strand:- start:18616 stop:18831 length:216 start_codon:yes stop_codon:yes gene_type:complete